MVGIRLIPASSLLDRDTDLRHKLFRITGNGNKVHGTFAVAQSAENRADDIIRRNKRNTDKAAGQIRRRVIDCLGVDMAETIGWTKRSKRTVSATEAAINSVTVFPISCAAPFRSPAPTACPMLTVVPIARPTIMTVSMCITCEPTETAVVLARPQTVLINSATVAKSRGGKKFFSCGHPQVLLSPPRAARKGECERIRFLMQQSTGLLRPPSTPR